MGSCCGCESQKSEKGMEETHGDDGSKSTGDQDQSHQADDRISTASTGSNQSQRSRSSSREKQTFVALFDYVPSCPAELPLKKGDRVEFLSTEPGNFMFVRQAKLHGIRGYVPAEFLAREGSGMEEPFFYGEISSDQAVSILKNSKFPVGTFLVRTSKGMQQDTNETDRSDDEAAVHFVISVKGSSVPHVVHHYRVRMNSAERYYLKKHALFSNMRQLIEYYQSDKGAGDIPCKLINFVPKPVPKNRSLPADMRDRWREIPRDQLQLIGSLGEGRFGEVHKAIWNQPDGQRVTVVAKQLKKLSVVIRKDLLNEACTMKDLRHENIVRLYGVVSASDPYYIVTEFVKDGSLLDYLKKRKNFRKPPLPVSALIDICIQVCKGMAYLSQKRLVHRDLASRNILIDVKSEWPFVCTAKVSDFGHARLLNKDYVYRMKHDTYIATRWLAPEGFDTIFSTESDVWAFGITMIEMFKEGDDPWDDKEEWEVKKSIFYCQPPEKPSEMPIPVYDIVKRCCQRNPDRRPKFAQLVSEFESLRPRLEKSK